MPEVNTDPHKKRHVYLEVVDDTLAIEEVVRDSEEVPIERLAPWVALASILCAAGILPPQREEGRNLTVHQGLTQHNQNDHVSVSHEQED